ncbi:uncharacterized protein LOC110387883 isoform X2 [Numida meleagris]|uniref:uncharacterized protein LOC110387883 isoform X2 n=1 Tax=Numida meleagris TaxID=8996 RepID=UPI000B3DDDB6|nr:uncharacterized protein LOC110387883 isoform X2 [Numida meleagris]
MGTRCPRGQEALLPRPRALSSAPSRRALQKGCAAPMAPGGSSCTTVLATTGLLLPLCLVPAALLELWQPEPVLFVEPGDAVRIRCMADAKMDGRGKVLWYRRSPGEPPRLLLTCIDGRRDGFSCEYRTYHAVLHIDAARPEDTALYLCASSITPKLQFANGTVLLVGDSWRTHSWVQVLATHGSPHSPLSTICAVGAAGGPVVISWTGGERPPEMLGLGNSTELLLSPGKPGGLCKVRFNASGPHVQRSTELHEAAGGCPLPISMGMAAAGTLLLLLSLWIGARCLIPAQAGHQPTVPEHPEPQEELLYAHLTLAGPTPP